MSLSSFLTGTGFWVKSPLTGVIRRAKDYMFSDKIIQTKNNPKEGKWVVIEMLLDKWRLDSPDVYKAYVKYLNETRANLRDKKFGETSDKNMDRRLILSMPMELQRMIRAVYPVDELKFDKKFFAEFANRFRIFKIPEKI